MESLLEQLRGPIQPDNASNNENRVSEKTDSRRIRKRMRVLNLPREQAEPDNVKCSMCDIIIKFKKNLSRHMTLVHGLADDQNIENVEQASFECCENVFSSQYHLDRHTKSKKCVKNQRFECKKCLLKFTTESKLSIHMKKNCLKKYMCMSCFTFFKSKNKFQLHLDTHDHLISES